MDIQVYDAKGKETRKAALPAAISSAKPRKEFLHEIVTYYLTNRRRGCADTLDRGEVTGGGRKPWKQKHTGRARAGSNRSPLWRKGGIAHGPHPHSYRLGMPAAKRRMALAQSLNAVGGEGRLSVIEAAPTAAKTKDLAALLKAIKADKVLLVLEKADAKLAQAGRNLAGLTLAKAGDLNAYDVLKSRRILITEPALRQVAEMLDNNG